MAQEGAHPQAAKSGDLATEVVQDVNRLVGLEIALAKQELKELAIRNGLAVGLMAAGALFVVLSILVGVPVLIVVLVTAHWIAAAVWAAAYLLLGVILALVGKARLRIALPDKTIASLKETKTWALQRMRSTAR